MVVYVFANSKTLGRQAKVHSRWKFSCFFRLTTFSEDAFVAMFHASFSLEQ